MNTNQSKFTKTDILGGEAVEHNKEAWTLELDKFKIKLLIINPMVICED